MTIILGDDIINFKCLTLDDKDVINNYMKNSNIESYEYLFSSLYMWRKLNNLKYAILDDVLILEKNEEKKGTFYAQPVGYKKESLVSIIDQLKQRNEDFSYRDYFFGDVDQNFINDLKESGFKLEIIEDTDDFEYVYNTQDLIHLRGKKYHSKKNHYNTFVKTYNYEIKNIDNEETISDCLNLLQKWHEEVAVTVDKEMLMEIGAIQDVFRELQYLNLQTIAVYVEGKLSGFAVGERVNEKTCVIHAERGELEYKGIYSFINCKFLMESFADTEFVNRQEDTGNAGLRKAKQSYHPAKMVKKYLVKLL